MDPTRRVLVVDDDPAMRAFLEEGLSGYGFLAEPEASASVALERLRAGDYDAVLTDLRLPGVDGHALCGEIATRHPDVPIVVLTAFGTYEAAVDAMRAGAHDFLSKPADVGAIAGALGRAIDKRLLRKEVKRLREASGADSVRGFGELVGESPPMKKLCAFLERVAATDATVLLTGESGTGKEVVARALHDRGPRAGGRLVAINCAAMPETMLEAELFGHERGAFTDAVATRPGLFHEAHGGTIFLDEIADMPLGLQAKILRALQERKARRVGGREEIPFDARVIAATNRDLQACVDAGTFRMDLFFRINVLAVEMPPLRARGADVLLLASHFVKRVAERMQRAVEAIDPAAAATLMAYPWPGNVRELQNCIEYAVALARYDHLTVDDLPERVAQHRPGGPVSLTPEGTAFVTLDEMDKRYILRVLEAVGGNRTLAAKTLGLDRTTLWRRLERYGVAR